MWPHPPLGLLLLLVAGYPRAPVAAASTEQPNIVFIVADDLGFNDMPWHNPRVLAPTLGRLAEQGVVLEQAYVQPLCTPSRSALMTGRYPFHLGRQRGVLTPLCPTGLTLDATLFPERLQEAGYRTHIVGKWHLGYCSRKYTPTERGFQSFLGYWNGFEDYYTRNRSVAGGQWGVDFRENFTLAREYDGIYSSEVFASEAVRVINDHQPDSPLFLYLPFQSVHTPLEVPQKYADLYPDVEDDSRRTYLGMVSALDDAVKRVTEALNNTGLYENTVIVFTADNGGLFYGGGNNFPLRGQKATIWEGGTRAVSFVHSPLLEKSGYVNHQLIHITDWYPTLLGLAGAPATPDDSKLDGFDQWETISKNASSPREEMVYNIDEKMPQGAAIRVGDWKLVLGWPGPFNGWYPEPGSSPPGDQPPSDSADAWYNLPSPSYRGDWNDVAVTGLFNLASDPAEKTDLSDGNPDQVAALRQRIVEHAQQLVPADVPANDMAGDPNSHDHVYTTDWCLR